jgi:hypothetical protein
MTAEQAGFFHDKCRNAQRDTATPRQHAQRSASNSGTYPEIQKRSYAQTPTSYNHTQFSAAFTTNIAESNFRYTQDMNVVALRH